MNIRYPIYEGVYRILTFQKACRCDIGVPFPVFGDLYIQTVSFCFHRHIKFLPILALIYYGL